ncbi:MAG: hypothetical protein Unbinned6224contig1001_17 [Prokaryotic dsDNA virus sp.]|nr:MAG: hypothetical protein Unbinned6224contig1001_17 [Prokaryotic dsDNA virus sp.]|tara:strand:+ start:1273 stop:1605 length:333 start_codon:yes stop_codon:yes gene_type:complete
MNKTKLWEKVNFLIEDNKRLNQLLEDTYKELSEVKKQYKACWSIRDGENEYHESVNITQAQYEKYKSANQEDLFRAFVLPNGDGFTKHHDRYFEGDIDYRYFYDFEIITG